MAADQQKAGKPYSGTNKIPTVNEFISRLDRNKGERDKAIDSQYSDQVTAHHSEKPPKGGKTVTDPVTGNSVVIDNVGKEYMERADNPQVRTIPPHSADVASRN